MPWLIGFWKNLRHPELVSGSIYQPQPAVLVERGMLERSHRKVKQVQHDGVGIRSVGFEITNRK